MPKIYTLGHPLRSAYLKLRRAKVHIDGLERRVRDFRARYPDPILVDKQDPDGHRYMEMTLYGGVPPDSWGAIWGDIVGGLRDSLDHIAWQVRIVRVLTEQEERAIYFPIFDFKQSWDSFLASKRRDGKKGLELFRKEAHDVIEEFQPYNRDKRPELELLMLLDKLANFDKHRLIIPVYATSSLHMLPGSNVGIPIHLNFDDEGKMVIAMALNASISSQDFKPPAPLDIGFSLEQQGGMIYNTGYRFGHLALVHDLIRDKVLPKFAGLF